MTFPISDGAISFLGDGFFGSNSHEHQDDETTLYGAMGGILFDAAGEGEAGPYAFGQAGFLAHDYEGTHYPEEEGSETGLGFGGGGQEPSGSGRARDSTSTGQG